MSATLRYSPITAERSPSRKPVARGASRMVAKEPLAASLKLNQGTNYLTASVYEQIRALVAQGKAAEAASLAQNTLPMRWPAGPRR